MTGMQVHEQFERLVAAYRRLEEAEAQAVSRQVQQHHTSLAILAAKAGVLPETKALPVTVPVIFGRPYDENFISNYLAYVLDPQRNGLGDAPLSVLLSLAGCQIEPDLDEVKISREFTLADSSRIDLLIIIGEELVLGIENKIFASEGSQQTQKYERMIRAAFPDHQCWYIFLTPEKTAASSEAFYPLSYREMLQAFRKIAFDWKADIRKSVLWDDFLTHLEAYIVMDKNFSAFSEKTRLYIENYQMIKDIERSFLQDWERLISYLTSLVGEQYPEPDWVVDFSEAPSRNWHQISKSSWRGTGYFIHYEFWFSPEMLANRQFYLMVDVGRLTSQLLSLFEARYPAEEAKYQQSGIQFRPRNRKIAIAWKKYTLESDEIDGIGNSFLAALDEFDFLTPVIDEVIAEFEASKAKEVGADNP